MAFAINSAPLEPAISVRKHPSLKATEHPLKGPTAQGCKPLFPSAIPSAPEVCTHSRLLPRHHTRLGSRSAREGHNSCSIRRGAGLLPPRSPRSRERRVGEGSLAGQWRPRPKLLLPGKTRSGKLAGEENLHLSSCLRPELRALRARASRLFQNSLPGSGVKVPQQPIVLRQARHCARLPLGIAVRRPLYKQQAVFA